jgi:ATP:ADP antiporter, AAA family
MERRGGLERLVDLLGRVVDMKAQEITVALGFFITFALVLGSYYLIRPIRENIGAEASADQRQLWFLLVFAVMLAAVPLFGWAVARLRRSLIVPGLYIFFAALMMVFWLALGAAGSQWLRASFFVFASVFNLFVVSLFWILMSDIYGSGQAKRLYGFIAAGGTTGAVLGPLAANWLAPKLGEWNLILVAATVLFSAAGISFWLRDAAVSGANGEDIDAPPGFRTVMSGAESVIRDPYLLRIAFYVLMANFLSTFFYLEQVRLAGETIHEATARVQFFAQRDLITSVFTMLVQLLITGRITTRLGLSVAASALPAVTIAGLILYAAVPDLQVVAAIMVVERVTAFALSNPALKVLYTAVDVDERYKAQSFIDTVVYRGGDALSGAVFNGLAKSLGAVVLVSVPVAALWFAVANGFDTILKARIAEESRKQSSH